MYGITSQLPVLFSWNAAITHLAQDVSLCPFLEPWATLQSVVLSCLGCRFVACLYIPPPMCSSAYFWIDGLHPFKPFRISSLL